MPNPLDALKKATGIGADTSNEEKLQKTWDTYGGMMGTTIGPKAIPLWDDKTYLNKVLKSTLQDVVSGTPTTKNRWASQAAFDDMPGAYTDSSSLDKIISHLSKAFTSGPFSE